MVGLSSYLLIGYYQERESAIKAAKKAFVMNAFGDATMALALFLLIQHTGKLDYAGVFAASPHGGAVANLIALGLLGGARRQVGADPAAHVAARTRWKARRRSARSSTRRRWSPPAST